MLDRRAFLLSATAWFAGRTSLTRASPIHDRMPWSPFPSSPPQIERPGPWQFFTADEVRAIEAIADRIIPPDPETPGGKDAGCAVFIDRQLKGPYGSAAGLYKLGPYVKGTKEQGAAVVPDAGRALPQRTGCARSVLQGKPRRQGLRSALARTAGRHAKGSRIGKDQV
jgi:hypothetical protein